MEFLLITALPLAVMLISFYLIRIAGKHKALKSISESNYWLKKPWRWLFEAMMFAVGLSVLFVGLNLRADPIKLLIIAGAGIFGVGVFSRYKANKFIQYTHILCAYAGYGAAALSIWLTFDCWWGAAFQLVSAGAAILISKKKEKDVITWNVEVFLLYSIFMVLFPLIIKELV